MTTLFSANNEHILKINRKKETKAILANVNKEHISYLNKLLYQGSSCDFSIRNHQSLAPHNHLNSCFILAYWYLELIFGNRFKIFRLILLNFFFKVTEEDLLSKMIRLSHILCCHYLYIYCLLIWKYRSN